MPYNNIQLLTEKLGNNAFAWDERTEKYGKSPTLTIPSLINGTLDDIKIGEDIVFEEMENNILRSCVGLTNFVNLGNHKNDPEIIIFDNHNHALYFWIEAMKKGIIHKGFELIHIDEHSDLWNNENEFNLEIAITSPQYVCDFVNLSCNVGNYILPAVECGLVGNMIRIENEYQIDAYMDYTPCDNSVLNLDLDIFAPELDHIPENKKIQIIKNLIQKVKYVTIATSPYFIEPGHAISMLHKILKTI